MDLKKEIETIVLKNLKSEKLFIVDIIITGKKNGTKVIVILDGDDGVAIDTCAEISRKLSFELDERDIIDSSFVLEVSSAGVDHPLKFKRQYHKNIGRDIKIVLNDDNIKKGKLKHVNEDEVVIEEEVVEKLTEKKKKMNLTEVKIPFNDIKRTNVLISFK